MMEGPREDRPWRDVDVDGGVRWWQGGEGGCVGWHLGRPVQGCRSVKVMGNSYLPADEARTTPS